MFSTITRTSDYSKLKLNGKRYSPSKWLNINYLFNKDSSYAYGITVSKKVGNAVVRNKLKRWIRFYFSNFDEKSLGSGVAVNFIFRSTGEPILNEISYVEIKKALDNFFNKIRVNY